MTRVRPALLLHSGTPKTGSTGLQHALFAARERLLEAGILYPAVELDHLTKNRWIAGHLLTEKLACFESNVRTIADQAAAAGVGRVVLSAEGVYNHWWDFDGQARASLAGLAAHFDVTVWCVFRAPTEFARSYYVQVVKNPPFALAGCYGRDWSLEDALADPWFRRRLDYTGFINDIESLYGKRCVIAQRYEDAGIVELARRVLGVDSIALPDAGMRNLSVGVLGVDLLRRLNRTGLTGAERQQVVAAILEVDRAVGRDAGPVELGASALETVRALALPGLAMLEQRFGIAWEDGVGATSPDKGRK